jgi:polyisoprenoid-binding protein YceI
MKRHAILILLILLTSSFTVPTESEFTIDTTKSTVRWYGYYLFSFGEHYGTINIRTGKITVRDENVTTGNVTLDMNTINTLDMKADDGGMDLSNHLKSPDFFDAAQFPEAQFEILQVNKIKDASSQGPNVEVTGALTIKGIKNTITFPATLNVADQLSLTAKLKFDRTKWNIKYNSGKYFAEIGDGAISDAIGIELNIIATKNSLK